MDAYKHVCQTEVIRTSYMLSWQACWAQFRVKEKFPVPQRAKCFIKTAIILHCMSHISFVNSRSCHADYQNTLWGHVFVEMCFEKV